MCLTSGRAVRTDADKLTNVLAGGAQFRHRVPSSEAGCDCKSEKDGWSLILVIVMVTHFCNCDGHADLLHAAAHTNATHTPVLPTPTHRYCRSQVLIQHFKIHLGPLLLYR